LCGSARQNLRKLIVAGLVEVRQAREELAAQQPAHSPQVIARPRVGSADREMPMSNIWVRLKNWYADAVCCQRHR
jgi:hypothetical protein